MMLEDVKERGLSYEMRQRPQGASRGPEKYRYQDKGKGCQGHSTQPQGGSEERASRITEMTQARLGMSPRRPPGRGETLKEGRTTGPRGNDTVK